MPAIFQQHRSLTATNVPAASSLAEGQLAINIPDKKLWVGDAAGDPVPLLGGGAAYWDSDGDIQWNTNTGNVGIGTDTPVEFLDVDLTGSNSTVQFKYTDAVPIHTLTRKSSLGTIVDEQLGRISFKGDDETGVPWSGVRLEAEVKQDFTNALGRAGATEFRISTTDENNGMTPRVKIGGLDGHMSVGKAPPPAEVALHVYGTPLTAPASPSNRTRFLVENEGNNGMLVRSGSSSTGFYEFGDTESANSGAIRYDHSLDQMAFLTSNVAHMYITSDGDVLFGKSTSDITTNGLWWDQPADTLTLTAGGAAEGTGMQVNMNNYVSGTFYYHRFKNANVTVGSIRTNGASAVTFATTSDERLKQNIGDAGDALSVLQDVQVRDFDWKNGNGHVPFGFIAQELNEVFPSAVGVGGDDPNENPWDYDAAALVPLLVKAIQELQEQVNELR
jgi:hypothetical protein